jgi:hypothetical protein
VGTATAVVVDDRVVGDTEDPGGPGVWVGRHRLGHHPAEDLADEVLGIGRIADPNRT